jgi:coenzyme F420 hydrogenase subunit beta
MSGISEAPGKVWFWELAAAVIDADRCVQCGTCVAACPTDSIGIGSDNLPKLVKMCTGCSLCWDFCPRGGMRYETTWLREEVPVLEVTGVEVTAAEAAGPVGLGQPGESTPIDDWKITGVAPGPVPGPAAGPVPGPAAGPVPDLGLVRYSTAARVRSESKLETTSAQDGGVVSAILLAALEAGAIDGALVAREDPDHPWKGVPHLATTASEIRDAAGSFYNQTMALGAVDLAAAGLAPDARIAVVGTPCEIQGIRALQARQWRRGSSGIDAIVLSIALLCTKSFDYTGLMLRELRDARGLELREIGKVDVVHGRLVVEDLAGAVIVDEPIKQFHGAALKGCDECADFLGRGADISVGSVGSGVGYSSVLVRTPAGLDAFNLVRGELEIHELDSPDALVKLDRLDKKIASTALHRPFEPDGPLFVDFAEHLAFYDGSDRAPVWQD